MKQHIQSLSKYLLALLVMAGAWGCASTTGLQNANQDDDDVYFSRKDREQAKIAQETAIKNTPTVTKTTTTVNNNSNSNGNGLEVNPTYGVSRNNQTDVNPEYVENYNNNNSTITQNGITYSGNEYYTETRANNNRVQVPRTNVDTWGNTNTGVFYDPYLDPASPFFNPYASTSNLRFGWNQGWGNNWRYRRWANRYRWYDPYYRNDAWFYRNVWWYGGYSRNNAWCPTPSRPNTIYTGTTRIESRPRQFVNRNPRRSGAGRRGSTIINNNRVNTKRRATRVTNGTDVNKRAATAGRRYKRTTNSAGKRVNTNSSGRQLNRTSTTTRPRRTQTQNRTRTRTRRSNSYSRTRNRSSNFNNNRSNTRSRSRSTYKRSTSRPSYSKPRTRTFKRTTKSSSPSRSKRSGGSRRKK